MLPAAIVSGVTVFPAAVFDRMLNGAAVGVATGSLGGIFDSCDDEGDTAAAAADDDDDDDDGGTLTTPWYMVRMLSKEASEDRSISAVRTLKDRPVKE